MEERKWEDMNSDCLVNIFGRLELKSKVLVIPLVCKPWYQAVHNPLCWERLIFPRTILGPRSQTELIKFFVNRSQRCATSLALPDMCDREDLVYVSEECPDLKMLFLPYGVCMEHKDIIPNLIVKWKKLESLLLGCITCVKEILELIHIHLPSFICLCLTNGDVDGETASAIVSLIPNVKCLFINQAKLKKEDLLLILRGCKRLEYLDVRNCTGFDEGDDEILRLASGIKNFQCDGSTAKDPLSFMHEFNELVLQMDIEIDLDFLDAIGGDDFQWDEYQWEL
ncbi:putative F-box/LRR-repeat protein 23 [Heracleum sosnowskyi]|uniref:F-box/LRR-repeat protein 23 n=2 Tax=Heracleum sosnowskyi TaxID=360622 RepID=A0AAD8JHI2_9APIA|nr:putative F-box/LRR-repeat protein 23 [Heracleum sosnowskyi]KAK1403855.1 putative F-box/LRR-repeat protein 23 [Heracleum sosnowskyi]KAK1403856.1 putative F-box/LRR-repeat protein 23 [Heracleum sosnowskyi]